MDVKKIEDLYQKGNYNEIIELIESSSDAVDNEHIKRLYVRAANHTGQGVDMNLIPGMPDDDIDLLWNRVQFALKDENKIISLLRNVLIEGREDIVEDIVITYLDRYEKMPLTDDLLKYAADNRERPIIRRYLNAVVDEAGSIDALIIRRILDDETSAYIKKLISDHPFIVLAYEKFLKQDINSELIDGFLRALSFHKGNFFILDGKIMQITGLEEGDGVFKVKTKTGLEKQLPFDRVIDKTNPIEADDFRVYKFFKPQIAKQLEPCELLKSIIRYHGNAVDRDTLKKELVFIYGQDAVKYYTSHRKIFEKCPGIHVIFSKNERYTLSDDNENAVIAHIKRLNSEEKVRDYIIETVMKSAIDEETAKDIMVVVEEYSKPYRNEIMCILMHDSTYAYDIDKEHFDSIKSGEFIEAVINERVKKGNYNNEELLIQLDEAGIERIYKNSDDTFRQIMLELAERSIRLGTDLIFLSWYVSKQGKTEISFPKSHIYQRMLIIANNISASTKSDPYLSFVRKFLFNGKHPRFTDIIREMKKKDAKELFDIFMASSILSDYQRDQIRIAVYEIYPDFREIKKTVYEYSTRQGIEKKQAELDKIIKTTLPELTVKIREAAEHGDLSENAEYKYSREQYRFMSSLAQELGDELSKAHPIDMDAVEGNKVEAGTVISIRMDEEGEEKNYTVLGPLDVDEDGKVVSYKSPIIEKIEGMKAGDSRDGITVLSVKKYMEDQ